MTTPPIEPAVPEPETEVVPAPAARPFVAKRGSTGSSRVLNIALGAAVLVAAVGVAFAAGRGTAAAPSVTGTVLVPGGNGGTFQDRSSDPNGTGNGFPGGVGGPGVPGDRGGFGGLTGGLTITGTIDSVSAESITIKLESGQTVTVGLDGSTTYHQQADAAASDVTAGKTVQLQITGGFRPDQNGTSGTPTTLGTAGSVTIIP